MNIGILAVQGAFAEHAKMLEKLGTDSFEIRNRSDLDRQFDGLILPGGESTVMGKLLTEQKMMRPIRESIENGMPVLGTCAGMILLAKNIVGGQTAHLGTMDITVVRNAYGRQLGSFRTISGFNGRQVDMVFIRAPYIEAAGGGVEVLSTVEGRIVAARQGRQLAAAFHPELTDDTTVHEYFLQIVCRSSVKSA